MLPLGDPFRPSFEMVRLDKEWLRVVDAVDAEFRVELDLVVGVFPLDLLSSEALSWWKLAFGRRLRSLKNGIEGQSFW